MVSDFRAIDAQGRQRVPSWKVNARAARTLRRFLYTVAMPPDAQEQRCIDLARRFLGATRGGEWKQEEGDTPDDQFDNISTPEVIVTNGTERAAIEVKEVTGDPIWDRYRWSRHSLLTSLVPSCGGSYLTIPFDDLRLPMEPKMARRVKKEVERVAPTLTKPGDRGAIRIPRFANVVEMNNHQTPSRIDCYHSSSVVLGLSDRLGIPGWYPRRRRFIRTRS